MTTPLQEKFCYALEYPVNQLFKLNNDFTTDDSTNNHKGSIKFMNGIESSWKQVACARKKPLG